LAAKRRYDTPSQIHGMSAGPCQHRCVDAPTWEQEMIEVFRDCPDCGQERGFVRRHDHCPDAADGCPEWLCAACGAGLFLGLAA
jgi:hypothetical protein